MEDERVRELLGRVNGIDMDVVFAPRKEPLVQPRYRLMTRDQLHKVSEPPQKSFIMTLSLSAACRPTLRQLLRPRSSWR